MVDKILNKDDTSKTTDDPKTTDNDYVTGYVVCVFSGGAVTSITESSDKDRAHEVADSHKGSFVLPVSRRRKGEK